MIVHKFVTLCLCFFASCCCLATNASYDIESFQTLALKLELHNALRWKKLLHYKKKFDGQFKSLVDDPRFFLSPRGKHDPKEEILATINLLLKSRSSTSAKNKICKLPARVKFLQDNLLSQKNVTVTLDCPEYQKWRSENSAEAVWMIFPSSYVNSPSSMFGHTFLRLDSHNAADKGSSLLSKAVNYAAKLDKKPNGFNYVFKGLTGGYPGYFSMMHYYEKVKEYSRIENRDIWEYQLNLNAEEINWLLMHLWELNKIRFDYFFITQNCSYQLLALLEVARPESDLTSKFDLVAIPVDTVRALDQRGWITSSTFRPSMATAFAAYKPLLTETEKKFIIQFKKTKYAAIESELKNYRQERQILLLDAAYKLARLDKELKGDRQTSLNLLKARSKLGKASSVVNAAVPLPPESGHFSRRFGLGAASINGTRHLTISAKAAYHSIEDPIKGFSRDAEINFINGRVNLSAHRMQVEALDLISIRSLSPSDSYISRTAWQVNVGWHQALFDKSHRELAAQINAGFGKVYSVNKLRFSSLIGTQVEAHENHKQNIQLGPRVDMGLLFQSHRFSTQVRGDITAFWQDHLTRRRARWISAVHLQRNRSISFSLGYEDNNLGNQWREISLQLNQYF